MTKLSLFISICHTVKDFIACNFISTLGSNLFVTRKYFLIVFTGIKIFTYPMFRMFQNLPMSSGASKSTGKHNQLNPYSPNMYISPLNRVVIVKWLESSFGIRIIPYMPTNNSGKNRGVYCKHTRLSRHEIKKYLTIYFYL
jgi:hypothetical protein